MADTSYPPPSLRLIREFMPACRRDHGTEPGIVSRSVRGGDGRISRVRWCSTRTGSNFYSWLSKNGAANLLVQSDVDLKSGTLPNKTFDTDLRTMRFRNPPRDRKAKPGSGLPGARLVRAVETLENNG